MSSIGLLCLRGGGGANVVVPQQSSLSGRPWSKMTKTKLFQRFFRLREVINSHKYFHFC
jgi:hypothetical protein